MLPGLQTPLVKLPHASWFASLTFTAANAFAQYSTGFESPPFSSGEINGQDSWTVSANTPTARVLTATEIATELTNAGIEPGQTVHSGSQALVVSGTGASNATIRAISGLETQQIVLLDIWARPLPGGNLGNIFLTMEDSAGDRAAAFRFGTALGTTIDYGTTVTGIWKSSEVTWTTDAWYHLTLSVNYLQKTYDFWINGTLANTEPIPFYNSASDDFRQIRIFRGSNQGGMIVDDLTVVPEPTTAAGVMIGLAMMLSRRRRSQR
jgi:hypothetical protein